LLCFRCVSTGDAAADEDVHPDPSSFAGIRIRKFVIHHR
jgi:hypothetical protein